MVNNSNNSNNSFKACSESGPRKLFLSMLSLDKEQPKGHREGRSLEGSQARWSIGLDQERGEARSRIIKEASCRKHSSHRVQFTKRKQTRWPSNSWTEPHTPSPLQLPTDSAWDRASQINLTKTLCRPTRWRVKICSSSSATITSKEAAQINKTISSRPKVDPTPKEPRARLLSCLEPPWVLWSRKTNRVWGMPLIRIRFKRGLWQGRPKRVTELRKWNKKKIRRRLRSQISWALSIAHMWRSWRVRK
jgi:hypothetical protein